MDDLANQSRNKLRFNDNKEKKKKRKIENFLFNRAIKRGLLHYWFF